MKGSFSNGVLKLYIKGEFYEKQCTQEEVLELVSKNLSEEELLRWINPKYSEISKEIELNKCIMDKIYDSKYLVKKGDSVYYPKISDISLPQTFIRKFIKAEMENNEKLIQCYSKFWFWCSCNPDARCRENLMWFLDKYDMQITEQGLFVAYRLVDIKVNTSDFTDFITNKYINAKLNGISPKGLYVYEEEEEDEKYFIADYEDYGNLGSLQKLFDNLKEETTVYTDRYTHKMTIKLGEPVFMPRHLTDTNQDNTCSSGLHAASREWLKSNYHFGSVPLMVLINPAEVVAVPREDNYGKLRCHAYYPVKVVDLEDENSFLLPDGAQDSFIKIITDSKTATVNNEETVKYTFIVPQLDTIDRESTLHKINNWDKTHFEPMEEEFDEDFFDEDTSFDDDYFEEEPDTNPEC